MIWLFVSVAMACSYPDLPSTLLQLAPLFLSTGSVATFGRFTVPANSTSWTFQLEEEALLRY